mmetsp:Transcript_39024/g.107479  ORF Transcript_39024/g.107479 Transcript_39024/m.107479 type:complete len:208 (+) Transcript_39024:367-990(+)
MVGAAAPSQAVSLGPHPSSVPCGRPPFGIAPASPCMAGFCSWACAPCDRTRNSHPPHNRILTSRGCMACMCVRHVWRNQPKTNRHRLFHCHLDQRALQFGPHFRPRRIRLRHHPAERWPAHHPNRLLLVARSRSRWWHVVLAAPLFLALWTCHGRACSQKLRWCGRARGAARRHCQEAPFRQRLALRFGNSCKWSLFRRCRLTSSCP